MARITDYASLATGVQSYLKRGDLGVASGNLDYLIQEVEQELNARLRVRRMLTAITPTVSSAGVVTLPADYGGWKRFQVRDGSREWDLDLKNPEQLTDISALYTSTGIPKALVTGATSQIVPYTDGVYTFAALYYARVPTLSSTATTNWVVANFPFVYLYGCLAAAGGYATDDARFAKWASRFDHAVDGIEEEDAKDIDARTAALLSPNTSLFSKGSRVYNVLADSY